ncbi:MAG: protease pro-enzyme activation domain-containing protein [Myxococcota bacterium]|nr:protease pro-enzyme activation domain-containing protein [Myxococcota bacterium]
MGRLIQALVLSVTLVVTAAACHDPLRIRNVFDFDGGTPLAPPLLPDAGPPVVPDAGPAEVPDAGPPLLPDAGDPTPTPTPDGVPAPLDGVYTDSGPADEDAGIRGLVSFHIREKDALEQRIRDLYDPSSPEFRRYMTPAEWISLHSPHEVDVNTVADWFKSQGFQVPFVATNRLLFEFTGTVGQFNRAFDATVHVLSRKSPQGGNPNHDVFGFVEGGITMPRFVSDRIHSLATLDLAAEPGPMSGEVGPLPDSPPPNIEDGLTPQQVAHAYNFDALYDAGFHGQGVRLGITVGAGFRFKDVEGFWKSMGITREKPRVIQTMEPPATRYRETTLDIEWAGAMAPRADLLVYMGPDARNTSMLFTFNEAIARGEVDVITNSFAHREDSEPRAVEEAYNHAAMMAPALGITVAVASGDSAGTDVPSSSPWVTAVGGTEIRMEGLRVVSEIAWHASGSGPSQTHRKPWWQQGHVPGNMRGTADLSINSSFGYWTTYLGDQRANYGTSYAAPVFAGMAAVINSARASQGKVRVGWLNQTLYTDERVQRACKDITEGGTWSKSGFRPAGPGWDYPTGFGAPDAQRMLDALP